MNAVEIEQAITDLAELPFDAGFPLRRVVRWNSTDLRMQVVTHVLTRDGLADDC